MPNLGPDYDLAVRLKRVEDILSRMGQNPLGQAFSASQSDGTVGWQVYEDPATGATGMTFYQGPNTAVNSQTGQHPPLLYIGQLYNGGAAQHAGVTVTRESGIVYMQIAENFGVAIYDKSGDQIFGPDESSGQGLARPYLPGCFYRSDTGDWVGTTSTTFVTKFRARMPKQQPQLWVQAWGYNDTSGATGALQVLVNGAVWGASQSTSSTVIGEHSWGPLPVDGAHESDLTVELQACVTSGTGAVRVEPSRIQGFQST